MEPIDTDWINRDIQTHTLVSWKTECTLGFFFVLFYFFLLFLCQRCHGTDGTQRCAETKTNKQKKNSIAFCFIFCTKGPWTQTKDPQSHKWMMDHTVASNNGKTHTHTLTRAHTRQRGSPSYWAQSHRDNSTSTAQREPRLWSYVMSNAVPGLRLSEKHILTATVGESEAFFFCFLIIWLEDYVWFGGRRRGGNLHFFAKCTTKQRLTHFPGSGQGRSRLRGDGGAMDSSATLANGQLTSCEFFFARAIKTGSSWMRLRTGKLRSHWLL